MMLGCGLMMCSWTMGVLAGKRFLLSSLCKKFLCLGVMFGEGGSMGAGMMV